MTQGEELALDNIGEFVTTEGNSSFFIDESIDFWIVKEGRAYLYGVNIDEKGNYGRRCHLCTVEKNEVFLGAIIFEKGRVLVAGEPDTKLLKCKVTDLGDKLPDYIDRWMHFVTRVFSLNFIMPRHMKLLVENDNLEIEKDQNYSAMDKVLWVKHLEGSSLLFNRNDIPPVTGDFFFPISQNIWLKTTDKCKLTLLNTKECFSEHNREKDILNFQKRIGEFIKIKIDLDFEIEEERLKQKKVSEAFQFQESIQKIASSMDWDVQKSESKRSFKKDPLLDACQLVGERLGIKIKEPESGTEENKFYSPIYMIAKASKIRIRKITLTHKWWEKDSGPLLGFYKNNNSPVALLPTSFRSYNIVDPNTNKEMRVTQDAASSLSDTAYVFYKPLPNEKVTFSNIIKFALPNYKYELVRFLILSICIGILGMIFPVVTGLFFDIIVPGARHHMLVILSLALLGSSFSVAIFQVLQSIVLIRIDGKMKEPIQSAVWDRILSLPCSFFRQFSSGDLASRSLGVDFISSQLFTGLIFPSILGAIYALFNFILLFYYDVELAIIGSLSSIVLVAIISIISYFQISYQRKLYKLQGKIAGFVYQLIAGIPKLKVAGSEIMAFSKWAEKFSLQNKYNFIIGLLNIILSVFNSMLPLIMSTVIFTNIVSRGDSLHTVFTAGMFLAFNAAFTSFTSSIMQLGSSIASLMNVIPVIERIKPILETLPEVNDNKKILGELTGHIDVSHVSFRYHKEGDFILKDVSFNINPGEFVAFVGPSGSGKSTIFRLLLGFEEPEVGSIYYDGENPSNLDVEFLRRQIGVVIQNSKLMTGEIYYNIIGSSLLTIDDAWEAARMAGIEEDIKAMPMGMHTMISEGGGTFSGGQKQRLLIARALVKKPRIILFDEATSALDNKSQEIVTESLNKLNVTRIVIAHRLSTVIKADRIYVLIGGQIVQTGTYTELMNMEGPFREIAKRQLA